MQPEETAFCSSRQLASYAARHGLNLKEAMAALLANSVWPERFRRNYGILSAAAQIRLLDLPIVIAGCGGLGGAMAEQLVRLGAGNIRLYDHDSFEESNLNRQRFCTEANLGQPKAIAVAKELKVIASYGDFTAHICKLTPQNLPAELAGAEILIDCLDSVAGKIMLEQAATNAGIAWLHGSVLEGEGFACLLSQPDGILTRLYGAEPAASGAGAVFSNVVAGTAALMCALFVNWLSGKSGQSPLIHVDFTVPELDAFRI